MHEGLAMTGNGRRNTSAWPDHDDERQQLAEPDWSGVAWRRRGPYLGERQWGTVREDYSSNGYAWSYFTHDQARSRACRWGEDGTAGISGELLDTGIFDVFVALDAWRWHLLAWPAPCGDVR
jgi:hypothetical protein